MDSLFQYYLEGSAGPGMSPKDDVTVTQAMKTQFNEAGYMIIRKVFSQEELDVIRRGIEQPDGVIQHAIEFNDGEGKRSKMALWNQPGNDVTGIVARTQKIAGVMQELLGGEVYHYHTKLMMKEARTGGKFVWHQDYGYWYQNGCLFPDMGTVFIAIDSCTMENGCLQVLRGSHKCGRIEHKKVAGQTGAEVERVEQILNHQDTKLVNVELDPGDVLYFHCNLLHTSAQNLSPNRRWAFLCAFNCKSNNPTIVHHHCQYTPLKMVSNDSILGCTNFTDLSDKDFYPSSDPERMKYTGVQVEHKQTNHLDV